MEQTKPFTKADLKYHKTWSLHKHQNVLFLDNLKRRCKDECFYNNETYPSLFRLKGLKSLFTQCSRPYACLLFPDGHNMNVAYNTLVEFMKLLLVRNQILEKVTYPIADFFAFHCLLPFFATAVLFPFSMNTCATIIQDGHFITLKKKG